MLPASSSKIERIEMKPEVKQICDEIKALGLSPRESGAQLYEKLSDLDFDGALITPHPPR